MDEQKRIKKNYIFLILLGVLGAGFGFLNWDGIISDVLYLKYEDKVLVSIIAAGVSAMKILATLVCIKVTQAKRTNLVFYLCMITSAVTAIISAVFFENKLVVFFSIFYLLNTLIMEVFSGYHYTFAKNSLPQDKALIAHSKRISVFKIVKAIGIAVAGFLSIYIFNNLFYVIAILVTAVFIVAIILTSQVKNNNKNQELEEKKSYLKALNVFQYSKYMKLNMIIRFLSNFALTSLVVLVSVKMIDGGQNFEILKIVKSLVWVVSGIGFFCSSYFLRKKQTVFYDFFIKLCVIVLFPFMFILPELGFVLIILKGLTEPFNTMSNFEMLGLSKEKNCDLPQQELVINLCGYLAGMLSSFILLNMNFIIAVCLICLTLLSSIFMELIVYIKKVK